MNLKFIKVDVSGWLKKKPCHFYFKKHRLKTSIGQILDGLVKFCGMATKEIRAYLRDNASVSDWANTLNMVYRGFFSNSVILSGIDCTGCWDSEPWCCLLLPFKRLPVPSVTDENRARGLLAIEELEAWVQPDITIWLLKYDHYLLGS